MARSSGTGRVIAGSVWRTIFPRTSARFRRWGNSGRPLGIFALINAVLFLLVGRSVMHRLQAWASGGSSPAAPGSSG